MNAVSENPALVYAVMRIFESAGENPAVSLAAACLVCIVLRLCYVAVRKYFDEM